jgi:hypothetical protein
LEFGNGKKSIFPQFCYLTQHSFTFFIFNQMSQALDGSFAVPRDFHNGTDFDRLLERKPLVQDLTKLTSETPWNEQIFVTLATLAVTCSQATAGGTQIFVCPGMNTQR